MVPPGAPPRDPTQAALLPMHRELMQRLGFAGSFTTRQAQWLDRETFTTWPGRDALGAERERGWCSCGKASSG